MRMPQIRITIWRLMLVVAIVACMSGIVMFELKEQPARRLREKAARYIKLSREFGEKERFWELGPQRAFEEIKRGAREQLELYGITASDADAFTEQLIAGMNPSQSNAIVLSGPHRAKADHFRLLRLKYELAAEYPSLPIPPDPPEPP